MCAGIQPRETTTKYLHLQFTIFQKLLINSCNLQFTTCGGLNVFSHIDHLIRIEIKTNYSIVALGLCWFLNYTQAVTFFVKFSYTIALGIRDPVAKYSCVVVFFRFFNSFA